MELITKEHPILSKEPILKRMFDTDDYIVSGVGNYWWANTNHPGCLIEGLTSEERNDLFRLHNEGRLIKNTKHYNLNN